MKINKTKDSQAKEVTLPEGCDNPLWVVDLLRQLGAVHTNSQARRLISGNSVSINDDMVTDFKLQVAWKSGDIVRADWDSIYKLG